MTMRGGTKKAADFVELLGELPPPRR